MLYVFCLIIVQYVTFITKVVSITSLSTAFLRAQRQCVSGDDDDIQYTVVRSLSTTSQSWAVLCNQPLFGYAEACHGTDFPTESLLRWSINAIFIENNSRNIEYAIYTPIMCHMIRSNTYWQNNYRRTWMWITTVYIYVVMQQYKYVGYCALHRLI